ncbi:hypothetical protein [Alcaligenes aquatilis]|uniref:hypothetical protein n=1 Tax=Alcaligenes aquatilis TaxID=323284 RepID=UPI000D52EF09|nr:hypothetical protein [Alcaligenes aquatilis]AWG33987.1 hypothetical protein CA948_02020 [Alcaligenes aquatilis]
MNMGDWPCWGKVGVAVGLTAFVFNWPDSSGEWASWIQAFGSIGAIVGAIWVFSKQSALNAERDASEKNHKESELKRERLQRLLALQRLIELGTTGLASFCRETCEAEIETVSQLQAAVHKYSKRFDLGKEVLKGIDLSIYPNIFLGLFVINLRHQANCIDQAVERAGVAKTASDVKDIQIVLGKAHAIILDISKRQADFARNYDGSAELSGAFTLD